MAYPDDIDNLPATPVAGATITRADHYVPQKTAFEGIRDRFGSDPTPNRNYILNSNMDFNQRLEGNSTGISSDIYVVDKFKFVNLNHTGVIDFTWSTTTPDDKSNKTIQLDVTTADASLATNVQCGVECIIEGHEYMPLHNGRDITLSFCVRSSKTGTYAIGYQNNNQDRSYVAEYAINSANTWELKTISIQTDTTGTWDFNSDPGLKIMFSLAMGTDFHTTADSWQAVNGKSTASAVNWLDSTANVIYLSQVKLEQGAIATTYQAPEYVSELDKLLRYFEKSYELGIAPGAVTTAGAIDSYIMSNVLSVAVDRNIINRVLKRTAGTVTLYSPSTGTSGQARNFTTAADVAVGTSGVSESSFYWFTSANQTSADNVGFHYTIDSDF